MPDINKMAARSGKVIRSDNTIANEADGINLDGSRKVQLTGSFVRLSTEPKPTPETDGVQDGNSLTLVDTGQIFKFYQGSWWEL